MVWRCTVTARDVQVEGLVKRYGELTALAGVDLVVPAGSVVALLGANGAGKTTLVRILTTLTVPDEGRARVGGADVVTAAGQVRTLIGVTGQYAAVDARLTPAENLDLIARLYHLPPATRRERVSALLEQLALTEVAHRRAGTLSGGTRRRLDIAAGLIGGTPVIVLDEPTTGLDPRTRLALWEVIRERAATGTTVLLTSQYLEEADQLADRIALLDAGRVVAEGTPDQLKDLVGATVLDVTVGENGLEQATAVLAALGHGAPQVDPVQRRLTLPADDVDSLAAVLARLREQDVDVIELGARRPTLDEVFLAFTGPDAAQPSTAWLAARATPSAVRPSGAEGASTLPAQRHPLRRTMGEIRALTTRNWRRLGRDPQTLALTVGQPILLLLGFRYLLGGAIAVPGGDYVQHLLPGLFTAAVIIASGGTAISLAQDLQSGIVDRFRTLPIARLAVLAARTTADQVVNLVSLAAIVALSVPLGFEFRGTTTQVVLALALLVLLGYALTWMYAAIGSSLRSPEAAYAAGTLVLFLLLFASSAFVPVDSFPQWLQPIARVQPVTITIDAVRALTNGLPAGDLPWQSALWSVVILLVSMAIAVRKYQRGAR
jgi:ABC-2 type transport system ATP-binding protein